MLKRISTALLLASAAACAIAQASFPSQPIRLVIPYQPGGGSDILARPIAVDLTQRLKQSVIVENKGGAGGNIGAQMVAQSPPDGHTILVGNNSHMINPSLYKKPGYDMLADFAPLTLLATTPVIVVVHKTSPIHSIADLVALARKQPGKLNYATAGIGTPNHLATLLFMKQTNTDMVHVAYKGAGPATLSLLQKESDVFFAPPAPVEPHIRSGDFRAIAVASAKRFPAFPTVPTIIESGIPGLTDYTADIWWGLFAPAKTDPAILDKLHAAIVAAVKEPKNSERWTAQGMIPTTMSRAEFGALVKMELQRWEKVVRENGITAE